jgi:hypothetical protein
MYIKALKEIKPSESETEKYIDFVVSIKAGALSVRGPYLAELQMHSLFQPSSSSIKALLVEYFQKFGDRHCFFEDTRFCYSKFDQAGIADLVAAFRNSLPTEENEKQQLKLVNICKVETLNYLNSENMPLESTLSDLVNYFEHSFALGIYYRISM